MRNYELAYIASPDLDEETLTDLQNRIQGWIEDAGGEVVDVEQWGRRKLAYPINNYRDGFYYFVQSQMPSQGPATLDQDLHVTEEVLRYMVIRRDQ